MHSKTFRDKFLITEEDDDILKSQYIIVSARIYKKRERKNIISAKNIVYPDAEVCMAIEEERFRDLYLKQLSCNKEFFAALIKMSIEDRTNIIFLCTKNESKMNYLKYLAEFIMLEFDYPCYEYGKYSDGITELQKYNKKKVLQKCNNLLDEAKEKMHQKMKNTKEGRKSIKKEYEKMTKKELKKILTELNLYSKGMSKFEMLDTLEAFNV